jgi:hypothetical protein
MAGRGPALEQSLAALVRRDAPTDVLCQASATVVACGRSSPPSGCDVVPCLAAAGRPSRRAALRIAASLLCTAAWASDEAFQPATYEITAQTVMPHLEESLRYATTRERRCLRRHELSSVFPILRHHSLEGCNLVDERSHGDTIHYLLVCQRPEVASGSARLNLDPGRIMGALEIKMGGKNMTFGQRIEATRQGECQPAP